MSRSRIAQPVLILIFLNCTSAGRSESSKDDLHGDPLPAGSIARLGTVRWRHGDGVSFVAFLPGGKALLSVGHDGTVRQWDVLTGTETRRFTLPGQLGAGIRSAKYPGSLRAISGGEANPRSIALGADGKVLALSDGRSAVHLWDVAAGKELRRISVAGAGSLAIALTADSKLLAVQDADRTVRIHEVATGRETGRCGTKVDMEHQEVMAWVAISPDGRRLAAVHQPEKAELTVWETDTAKELNRQTTKEPSLVSGQVEFSPDGKWLACTARKEIILADAASGKEVRRLTCRSLSGPFYGLLFAPDGKTLIAWEPHCREFHVWETGSGKHLRRFRGPTLESAANEEFGLAAISPDGKLLAVGGETGLICFLEVATGTELPDPDAHRLPLRSISISRDGKQVFTSDEATKKLVWDAATGRLLRTIPAPRDSHYTQLSGDGQWLMVIDRLDSMRREEIATGRKVPIPATGIHERSAIAVSSDGKLVAVGGTKARQGFVVVYDAGRKGRHDFRLPVSTLDGTFSPGEERQAVTQRLCFAPDGRILAASLDGEKVALWDLTTGRELPTIKMRRKDSIRALAFSADGKSLAVDARDDALRLYETATGQERRHYGAAPADKVVEQAIQSYNIGDIAVSPNRRLLAHSKAGGTMMLWDVAGSKELGQLKGHQADITVLAFSADSKTLASGSRDTTALLWDVAKYAECAMPRAVKLDAASRWNDLLGDDAIRAFDAVCALAASPEQSVPHLKENLQPAALADTEKLRRLLDELDNEQFALRKHASAELEKIGEAAIPLLRKALESGTSPEIRKRLEELLKKAENLAPRGEALRSLRAIEVLEGIGTVEAKAVLQIVAKGTPGATVTRAAQGALERLAR
jgi:WD40 repeat protein